MSHLNTDAALLPRTQRRSGTLRGLRFTESLEDEFRRYYSITSVRRARLMPSFTIMMTLISVYLRLISDDIHAIQMGYDLLVLLPLVVTTLYLSTNPDRYRTYQVLLALTGIASGISIVSLVFRPTLAGMPSYFSIEVAWIFGIWLILGLTFRAAALTAGAISLLHMTGMFLSHQNLPTIVYELVMLCLVNGIGATACYHLEHAVRRAFIESKETTELTDKLRRLARQDGLTGLHNRRSFDAHIARLWAQSQREEKPVALMLIDIDHFKAYNDGYGHQQGDDTLIAVARIIASAERRPLDFAARYGGEEFVLTLYDIDDDAARTIAESLRDRIELLQTPHAGSQTSKFLTVSIGVAIIRPDTHRSIAGAVQMADEALYEAKAAGRNRVVAKETGSANLKTGEFRIAGGAVG